MRTQTPIAVAIYLTDNGDIYPLKLYTEEEVQQVRDSEHPELFEDYKVIIVFNDLSTEDHT